MTEVTQVEGAPDTSIEKPAMDSTSTDVQTAPQDGSTRTTDQVADSAKYWQSEADKRGNELKVALANNAELKQAEVLLEQIKTNPAFVQDLQGQFSLKEQPASTSPEGSDDDELVTMKDLKASQRQVNEAVRLTGEISKASELLGRPVTADEIQKAYNTQTTEAQKLHYNKLLKEQSDNLRAGAQSVTDQIESTQRQPESVASTPAIAPEPEKEPEDNVIGGVKRAGAEIRRSTLNITRT